MSRTFDEIGPLLISLAWLAALITAVAVLFRRTSAAPR